MEGSSRFNMGGGRGQPPILPRYVTNTYVAQQQEIHENDVPQDAAARRRAANRDYSQKYRNKQLSHITKLEDQQKKLEDLISENSLQLIFHKEAESELLVENEALEEKVYEFANQIDAAEGVAARLQVEVIYQKLINQAKKLGLKSW